MTYGKKNQNIGIISKIYNKIIKEEDLSKEVQDNNSCNQEIPNIQCTKIGMLIHSDKNLINLYIILSNNNFYANNY